MAQVFAGSVNDDRLRTLGHAFEMACELLGVTERTHPLRERVASTVIELGTLGERDLERLTQLTLDAIRGNERMLTVHQ